MAQFLAFADHCSVSLSLRFKLRFYSHILAGWITPHVFAILAQGQCHLNQPSCFGVSCCNRGVAASSISPSLAELVNNNGALFAFYPLISFSIPIT